MDALTKSGGDHAIIRSGRIPEMTIRGRTVALAAAPVSRATAVELAEYLLPIEWQRALDEIGETRYLLPHRLGAEDDFAVDVTDADGDLCIDIERRQHHAPLFTPRDEAAPWSATAHK